MFFWFKGLKVEKFQGFGKDLRFDKFKGLRV
jgi:hypothetical protein